MTTLRHQATYQGFACKEVHFRRSDGLHPEFGTVVVDYSVLRSLELKSDVVPWRAVGGSEAGALSIHVWHEHFNKRKGSHASRKPTPPSAGSLRIFGDLVLETTTEGGEGGKETVAFSNIFLENAEEVSQDLARAREHAEGEIQLDVTDIRRYWGNYGAVLCRINCRLENGKYDPRTIKTPGRTAARGGTTTSAEFHGVPWPFEDVINYLFAQVPGSPAVLGLKSLGPLPPPEQIDSIGSTALAVIEDVLGNYGLVAKLLPDGNVLLARKMTSFLSPGQVAPEVGEKRSVTRISYETKSVTRIDVPPVVMVVGQPRVRRETQNYVPAFHDLDGRLYRLSDIAAVWKGYSVAQVNRQVFNTEDMAFQDVPPKPHVPNIADGEFRKLLAQGVAGLPPESGDGQKDDLHYGRKTIMLAEAYRVYAPASMFGSDAPRGEGNAPYWLGKEERPLPWVPMGHFPCMEDHLREPIPDRREKGDRGAFFIIPPIVTGTYVAGSLWTDPGQVVASLVKNLQQAQSRVRFVERVLDYALDEFNTFPQRFDRASRLAALQQHLEQELILQQLQPLPQDYLVRGIKEMTSAGQDKDRLNDLIRGCREEIGTERDKIFGFQKSIDDVVETFFLAGAVPGYGQVPWGQVPRTLWSLDPMTGIVTFQMPVATALPIAAYERAHMTAVADGAVTVTYGKPLNYNEASDYTSVLFARNKDGKGSRLVGVNRSSQVKPHVVMAPDMVMYEDSDGTPFNLQECIDQAEKKAKPLLEGPDSLEGYSTTFSGFVPCVLERGVNSVQYTWNGDAAYTFVAVNSPRGVGPEGPVTMKD